MNNKIQKKSQKLFYAGQYRELERICKLQLKKKKNDFQALHLFGLVQEKLGQLPQAIKSLEKATSLHKKSATIFSNLGHFYLLGQRYDESIKSCLSAIRLDNNNSSAFNNLGNAYLLTHDYISAEKAYLEALRIKPHYGTCLDNLGVCLTKQGRFLDAVGHLLRANEVAPEISSVYIHLVHTIMFMHNTKDALHSISIGLGSGILTQGETLELLVFKAKISWVTGQILEAQVSIKKSERIHSGCQNSTNLRNLQKYHHYLKKLLEERAKFPELYEGSPQKALFFVGDSHALSPSETVVNYKDEPYRILSSPITGCKAWHLGKQNANQFKSSLTALFQALPDKTAIIIGFGEIDCRFSEGILPAHLAGKIDYRVSIPDFIGRYVAYVRSQAAGHNHNLLFYGVPAPSTAALALLGKENKELLCKIIQTFNFELKKICREQQLAFLDVYSATADEDGQSNMIYHIDDNHLHPRLLATLFLSLNN